LKKKFLEVVDEGVFDDLTTAYNEVNSTKGKELPEVNKR